MRIRLHWNGGRNGWASCLVGFGWMPSKQFGWKLNIYLLVFVLSFTKRFN